MSLETLAQIFEILVFATVIYAFIRFLQETQGSAVFKGFIMVVAFALVGLPGIAEWLDLRHLRYVTDRGASLIMIGLIVIFSPELRYALVRVGETFWRQSVSPDTSHEEIAQAAKRLARRNYGALIVVEREIGIASFTEGAVLLDAKVSAPLLVSIFFKDTPLHDGAVIIRGKRVVAAGCVLPLSDNPGLPRALGTRHRAAIGATEENDAIAIVVSEETGRISICQRGQIQPNVTTDEVERVLSRPATEEDEAS